MQTTWGATSAYCVDAGGVGRRIPGGSRDFASDKGNKRRDIGWPVWYAGGSSKGVVEGVLNGEELGEGMVLVVSEANAEDVRGWGGTRGSDVGDDGFLPKVRGGYRRIGLVEVVWKVCALVMNCWINPIVILHDTMHGFRAGRSTETKTL